MSQLLSLTPCGWLTVRSWAPIGPDLEALSLEATVDFASIRSVPLWTVMVIRWISFAVQQPEKYEHKGIVIRPVQTGGQEVVEFCRQLLIFTTLSVW